jgi:hypothetical protein
MTMRYFHKLASLPVLALATLQANADPLSAIDVTDAVATLENQIPSITAVAAAVLGILFVVMAFKLVRRAAS